MPADITHESIAARLAEVDERRAEAERKAAAPFEKERASLQELCGGLGHVPEMSVLGLLFEDGQWYSCRSCSICGADGPREAFSDFEAASRSVVGVVGADWGASIAINAARDAEIKALEQVGLQIDALQRIADGGITGPI